MSEYNIYIDESCHLMNDYSKSIMAIGYIKIDRNIVPEIYSELKYLRGTHLAGTELKWSKISNSRWPFYKELIDFFFEKPIDFRCLLIKYKERLNHEQFNQGSHDNFYYKMIYFLLTNNLLNPPENRYYVYMDIKDTRGREKIKKIKEVFQNKYSGVSPFIHLQHIRSHENFLIQLTDFFIGAVTFKARGLIANPLSNPTKIKIINYLEEKSGYTLNESTEPWETKFNIFDHQPKSKNV